MLAHVLIHDTKHLYVLPLSEYKVCLIQYFMILRFICFNIPHQLDIKMYLVNMILSKSPIQDPQTQRCLVS
jgi:hypothetical protein